MIRLCRKLGRIRDRALISRPGVRLSVLNVGALDPDRARVSSGGSGDGALDVVMVRGGEDMFPSMAEGHGP